MTAAAWLSAAALSWHLSVGGALPKESPAYLLTPYAGGGKGVRVVVFEGAQRLSLRSGAALVVEDGEQGRRLAAISPGALISCDLAQGQVHASADGFHVVRPKLVVRAAQDDASVTVSSRGGRGSRGLYPGALEIAPAAGGLRVVEHVALDDYVAGVVDAELPDSFPLEAMKAQAIAARTYALFHLGDHERQGADLCGEVHCQVYRGLPAEGSSARVAAQETAGEVLAWNAMLVDAMYHSACGGQTAAAWEVRQGKLLPYLLGAPDADGRGLAYCAYEHRVSWEKRMSWREAGKLVSSNLGIVLGQSGASPGKLRSLQVSARGVSGRAEWLEVKTDEGTYLVRGDSIRWLFGNGRPGRNGLRSTDFELTVERDRKGRPQSVVVKGKGHGHGIGLCQWGARGRAAAGQSAEEILSAYYPGAEVVDLIGRRGAATGEVRAPKAHVAAYEPDLTVQAQANP